MNSEQLDEILRSNGYLDGTEVTAVELTPIKTNGIGSRFLRACISYSSASHDAPASLLIKRPLVSDRGAGEALAYQRILMPRNCPAVVRCYGVLDEGGDEPLWMLFEDLTATHSQTRWPVIPGLADCERAVSALGVAHAYWWGDTEDLEDLEPPVVAHQSSQRLAARLPEFVSELGDYLSKERVGAFERALDGADALMRRYANGANSTLVHNDAHFWNFLYPQQADGRCVMFDWPLWRVGFCGVDLAYMIAMHLYPEHRRRLEPVLLRRYQGVLESHGIDYSYDAVVESYRAGIVFGLLMPILEFSWGNPPMTWVPKTEKVLSAYFDHRCEQLL